MSRKVIRKCCSRIPRNRRTPSSNLSKGTFTAAPDRWIHICEHDSEPICFRRDMKSLSENPKWLDFIRHEYTVCPITEFYSK